MALTQRGNIRETIGRYNKSPDRYTDEEKRNLLQMALANQMDYKPESKPIAKGAYNMLDMATFGLLMPDAWEPHSIGEEFYGESGIDKVASGAGALVGGVAGGYGVAKGVQKGLGALKSLWAKRRSQKVASSIMNNGNNTLLEPQLGAGQAQGMLGAGRGIGLNPRAQGLPPRPLGLPPRPLGLPPRGGAGIGQAGMARSINVGGRQQYAPATEEAMQNIYRQGGSYRQRFPAETIVNPRQGLPRDYNPLDDLFESFSGREF